MNVRTNSSSERLPLESVSRALRLLTLLSEARSVGVSETAAELGVARSTAHRLLSTLVHEGFARQQPDSRLYVAGQRLMDLTSVSLGEGATRAIARSHLEALRRELDETVSLAVLDGARIQFIDAVEPSSALRVASRAGQTLAAHGTAAGKAALSTFTRADRHARLGPGPLEQLTKDTCTDVDALQQELDEIAIRGYAVSVNESEDGVAAVAVALPGASTDRPLAIGVSMPSGRYDPARASAIGRTLQRHAADLAHEARRGSYDA